MTDISTLSVGDRMRLCRHENVVPHPAPPVAPRIVHFTSGVEMHPTVIEGRWAMHVLRCVDCDIRWEAT